MRSGIEFLGYVRPQCDNLSDDDLDGLVDSADPDCEDSLDGSEYHLEPGDIVVVGAPGRLVRIEPGSQAQTVLLDDPTRFNLFGLGLDQRRGDLIITHFDGSAVLRLDPAWGDLATLASGGDIVEPREVAFDATGQILVTDSATDAVIGIDPLDGSQTIVAGDDGDRFSRPEGLVVEADGKLVVTDWKTDFPDMVYRIDPANPTTETVLSGGSWFEINRRLALEADGGILVVDSGASDEVYRLDPVTGGMPTTVSSGGNLVDSYGIDLEANGDILVVSRSPARVVRIDPVSGAQSVAASGGALDLVSGVRVVPAGCADGLDNDGDGAIDLADPGCADASDPWEVGANACDDGRDNDGDGLVDGADPHCSSLTENREAPITYCGLGPELALFLPLVGALRSVRRRRRLHCVPDPL